MKSMLLEFLFRESRIHLLLGQLGIAQGTS